MEVKRRLVALPRFNPTGRLPAASDPPKLDLLQNAALMSAPCQWTDEAPRGVAADAVQDCARQVRAGRARRSDG